MSKLTERIGNKINALRLSQNLTQAQLAEIVNVEPAYISMIEAGKRAPSVKTADKIATALGVTLNKLFEEE